MGTEDCFDELFVLDGTVLLDSDEGLRGTSDGALMVGKRQTSQADVRAWRDEPGLPNGDTPILESSPCYDT